MSLLLLLAGASGALAASGSRAPASAPVQAAAGSGADPLTPAEEQQAGAALQALLGVQMSGQRSAPLAPEVAAAGILPIVAPAQELLLVERHAPAKGEVAAAGGVWPRRADLYLYRYADDLLIHARHELESGRTAIIEEVRGVQLPLTQAERELAVRIAFADPALFAFLQAEHRRIVGEELLSAAQVEVRAFVYHSGAAPEIEPPEAARCGIQRCAQLLILTANNVTYSILPVINLSTLRTASVIPLAVEAAEAHGDGAPGDGEGGEGSRP